MLFIWLQASNASFQEKTLQGQSPELLSDSIVSHSCIHDQIIKQRRRPGRKVYTVTPQVYEGSGVSKPLHQKGRALLGISKYSVQQKDIKRPIRIFLNYDAVGHSPDRDCRNVGDVVKLGEPPVISLPGSPSCNPHGDPPISGDCWYNCTLDDIAGKDKRQRLRKVRLYFGIHLSYFFELVLHATIVYCSYSTLFVLLLVSGFCLIKQFLCQFIVDIICTWLMSVLAMIHNDVTPSRKIEACMKLIFRSI